MLRARFLWALSTVLLLGFVLRVSKPLASADGSVLFWDQDPVRSKLATLSKLKSDPSFMLMGSSLANAPNLKADAAFDQHLEQQVKRDRWSYSRTVYLSSELALWSGLRLAGINLACSGCMVADAESILQEAFAQGHRPDFIIYCVAPRDFMGEGDAEHAYHSFACTPATLIKEISSGSLNLFLDRIFGMLFHLYTVRSDYRLLAKTAIQAAARTRSISVSLPMFQRHPIDAVRPASDVQEQIANYEELYTHIGCAPKNAQWRHLRQLADLSRTNRCGLYLVNMPLRGDNMAVMPAGFYRGFCDNLQSFCARQQVGYVDLAHSGLFVDSDFSDSVHLRATGGKKAFSYIARQVAQDGLREKLMQRRGGSTLDLRHCDQ